MGVFRDMIDAVKDISEIAAGSIKTNKKQYNSLHERSMEGTLQFPHIVSRKLDIETAQMVCRASERALANFVQIAMSMSPNLYIEDGEDITDYIRQFHTNLGALSGRRAAKSIFNTLVESGYSGFIEKDMGKLVVTSTYNDHTTKTVVSNKEQLYSVLEDLNDAVVNKTVANPTILSLPVRPISEARNNPYANLMKDPNNRAEFRSMGLRDKIGVYQSADKYENDADNKAIAVAKVGIDNEKNVIASRANDIKQQEHERNLRKDAVTRRKDMDVTLNKNMLLDNDVRKSNELVNTLLHVRIQMISKDTKELMGIQDFVIGIKATMHPVTSNEMITNLVSAFRGNNTTFDFIRWTTGEISFMKDFVLNLSTIKQDVINRSAGASPLWLSAKRARNLSKIFNRVSNKNAYANVTIIMTKDEVDYIRDNYKIDFMNTRDVEKVTDALFLIDFIVVDMAAQICHFKFEAAQTFESVSFSGLEKENSRDERKFKEMLKALNRS